MSTRPLLRLDANGWQLAHRGWRGFQMIATYPSDANGVADCLATLRQHADTRIDFFSWQTLTQIHHCPAPQLGSRDLRLWLEQQARQFGGTTGHCHLAPVAKRPFREAAAWLIASLDTRQPAAIATLIDSLGERLRIATPALLVPGLLPRPARRSTLATVRDGASLQQYLVSDGETVAARQVPLPDHSTSALANALDAENDRLLDYLETQGRLASAARPACIHLGDSGSLSADIERLLQRLPQARLLTGAQQDEERLASQHRGYQAASLGLALLGGLVSAHAWQGLPPTPPAAQAIAATPAWSTAGPAGLSDAEVRQIRERQVAAQSGPDTLLGDWRRLATALASCPAPALQSLDWTRDGEHREMVLETTEAACHTRQLAGLAAAGELVIVPEARVAAGGERLPPPERQTLTLRWRGKR